MPDREDIFDIVDSSDRVVGRAPRSEVHSKGLLHRASHVLMFKGRGGRAVFFFSAALKQRIHIPEYIPLPVRGTSIAENRILRPQCAKWRRKPVCA